MDLPVRTPARLLVALLLISAATLARAELPPDWRPELAPLPGDGPRGPTDPFIIRLPAAYDPAAGRLALELDNVDVTSRVRPLDDSYTAFRYVPYTPLARGDHLLRLVEYRADGEIVERGRWAVTIVTVESGARYALGLGLSYRVDEKGIAEDLDRTQVQGGASGRAYHDDGERRYEGSVQLTIDSAAAERDAGTDAVELAQYLATRETEATRVAAGHETVGAAQGFHRGNLIFDGATRRGVSGTVEPGTWRTAVTAFAQRTEPITGFEHGLGVTDEDNRISGVFARAQPGASTAVGAGFVTGAGQVSGAGTVGSATPLEGTAANVVLDSEWRDGTLLGRGEFARSEVDLGGGFGTLDDEAAAASLRWVPGGRRGSGWDTALSYVRIGPDFRSIANLGASADIEEVRLDARNRPVGGTLSYALEASRGEDNVDDRRYATTRKDSVTAEALWEPRVEPGFGGPMFGNPSVTALVFDETTETVDLPAGSAALPVDSEARGFGAVAGFDHPLEGRWHVTWERQTYTDHEDFYADSESDLYQIDAEMVLLERALRLRPTLSHDVLENRDSGVIIRDTEWRYDQYWAIRDSLDWTFNWTLNHRRSSDDTLDTLTRAVDSGLQWRQSRSIAWSLTGSWTSTDVDGSAASTGDTETYQVFLGIRANLTGSWP